MNLHNGNGTGANCCICDVWPLDGVISAPRSSRIPMQKCIYINGSRPQRSRDGAGGGGGGGSGSGKSPGSRQGVTLEAPPPEPLAPPLFFIFGS